MADVLVSTPYASHPSTYYGYVNPPQPPPSPPMDETSKCSLPSISSLLGLADGGSPSTEQPAQSLHTQQQTKPETRTNSLQYNNAASAATAAAATANPLRTGLPPTPPMGSEPSFDGYNSPSTKSVSQLSASSAPNYYFDTTPPLASVEAAVPRAAFQSPAYQQHPQHQQAFAAAAVAQYMAQPALASSYYPPPVQPAAAPQPQISEFYYQRPLPQTFPPFPVSVTLAPTPSGGGAAGNPWQHHHYISPSSAAASSFAQPQDRYVCPTCSKAFSRPSSLRIHSHSHTGEKPFMCPHAGCGKAFSVRSNMKRHERSCHSSYRTGSNTATTTTTANGSSVKSG